ncbi:MAG: nucleotidyltransferase family protein [Egibacteraceae bacterium]
MRHALSQDAPDSGDASEHDLLAAVAAYGLPGCTATLTQGPLDDERWRGLLTAVHRQRLAGHLVHAITAGALPATNEQAEGAHQLHLSWLGKVLYLERLLLDVVRTVERAGIDYRVLKGPATAQLVYPDPALRLFADIDVLVPTDRFDEAVSVLVAAGCNRRSPELRPGFDRRFGKGATLVTAAGYEVDLHRTFAQGPFGLNVDLAAVFQTCATLRLGGRDLRTLDRELSFLMACYHAALGDSTPRLVPLRDVAQLLLAHDLDLERVAELARSWRAEAVVARAVRCAWRTLRLRPTGMSTWAEEYRFTREERRALDVYVGQSRCFAGMAIRSLRVIPRPADKAAYLRGVLFPQRAAVAYYERGYDGWWRRGIRALRGTPT